MIVKEKTWNISLGCLGLMCVPKQHIIHRLIKRNIGGVIPPYVRPTDFPPGSILLDGYVVPPFQIELIKRTSRGDISERPQMDIGLNLQTTYDWLMEPEMQWARIIGLTDVGTDILDRLQYSRILLEEINAKRAISEEKARISEPWATADTWT